jgi:hypothetical protein
VIAEFLVPVGFFHASAHTAFHTMEELSPNSILLANPFSNVMGKEGHGLV